MTLKKANLINSICDMAGLPKQISTPAVESLLEIIKLTLASGEDILIAVSGNSA